MPMCGKMCLNPMVENEAIKCVCCLFMFPFDCVNVSKQLGISLMNKWKTKNIQFRCDKCIEIECSMKGMMTEFNKL